MDELTEIATQGMDLFETVFDGIDDKYYIHYQLDKHLYEIASQYAYNQSSESTASTFNLPKFYDEYQ